MSALARKRTDSEAHPGHVAGLASSPHRPLVVGCRLGQRDALARAPRPSPALFVDRDGVLVENRDSYIREPADVRRIRGTGPALRAIQERGIPIVIVSNQSAAGRRLISLAETVEIHRHVLRLLAADGIYPACSLICPHHPDDGCRCRKPAPGMPLAAAAAHGLDLPRSCLVGDARSDVAVARRAGVGRAFLVTTGRGAREAELMSATERRSVTLSEDLAAAVGTWIAGSHRAQRARESGSSQ